MADEGHAGALCLRANGLTRRPLRTDEQHFAAVGHHGLDERIRVPRHGQAFLEIDDVDLVSLAEDVWCHLRVPVAGLMTKMHASL